MINDKNKTNTKPSQKDYWRTDPSVVDQLMDYWNIAPDYLICDAAATTPIPQARTFQDENYDSINYDWDLNYNYFWLNPPFSQKEIFYRVAWSQSMRIEPFFCFGLLPLDTSTKFFKFVSQTATEIALINKRIGYLNENGELIKGANFNSFAFLISNAPRSSINAKISLIDIKQ